MGRKKKAETAASTDSFVYQGNITLSVVKGKKTLFTKKYKNKGYDNLFKFLCGCLAGTYDKDSLPQKIVLFGGEKNEEITQPNFKTEKKLTDPILINTSPVITYSSEAGYKVTYHFSIPYAYIAGGNDNIYIYKAGLVKNSLTTYIEESQQNPANLCATYLFTNADKSGWEPLELEKATGNFSLVIQWELTIKN